MKNAKLKSSHASRRSLFFAFLIFNF
jgi:hypothetical protein